MARRGIAVVVAAVVTVAGWLGGAQPATAATDWWLPSSWIDALEGTVADAIAGLRSIVGGVPVTAGESGIVIGPPVTGTKTWNVTHIERDGTAIIVTYAGGNTSFDLLTIRGSAVCTNGQTYTNGATHLGGGVWRFSGGSCPGGTGGVVRYVNPGGTGPGGIVWNSWSVEMGALGIASTTTEMWCRDPSSGVDTVVTETVEGASAAPTPLCPAGTFPVRVRISNSVDGVVSDASISAAVAAQYGAYLGDPAGWQIGLGRGGVPCVPGDQICQTYLGGGDRGDTECWLRDPTMGITLSLAAEVCDEARDDGRIGQPDGGSAGGDTSDQPVWVQIIKVAIDTATSAVRAVKSAVDGVKSAVDRVVSGIASGISQIGQRMDQTTDRIIEAIEAVRDAVVGGVVSIVEKLNQIIAGQAGDGGGGDPGGGDPGGGEGPGEPGPPGGDPGDLAGKFTPWTDALGDVIGAFNRPDPGCEGPRMYADFGHGIVWDARPFDACDEPMRTVAGLSRLGLALLFVVGGGLACVRILFASLGLQTGMRGPGDGGD